MHHFGGCLQCPSRRDIHRAAPVWSGRRLAADPRQVRASEVPQREPDLTGRLRAVVGDAPAPGAPRRAVVETETSPEVVLDDPAAVETPDDTDDGPQPSQVRPRPTAAVFGRVLRLSRAHTGTITVLLVVALVMAATRVMAAQGYDVEAQAPTTPALTPAPSPTPTPTPEPPPVRVHVLGAVVTPGVVTLPGNSRVADAIAAADGLTADADPGELNFAAQVPDGSQIVVGTTWHPRGELRTGDGQPTGSGAAGAGSTGGTASSAPTLNLNTATAQQLESLPGVGPVTAQRILTWRDANGGFSRVEELQEVDGIGPKTYAQLAPLVHV